MKKIMFLLIAIAVFTTSCHRSIKGSYNLETECLGVEGDGSQTLKAWGTGSVRWDAIEQAKKNAVADVLFKGIRKGKDECQLKPVLFEVNARDNHEAYFNKFFADKGPYTEFVSLKDEPHLHGKWNEKKKDGKQVQFGIFIRILRDQLKQRMIRDGILKP